MSVLKHPQLIKVYEKLSRRASMYRKYSNPAWVSVVLGLVCTGVVSTLADMKLLEIEPIFMMFPLLLGIAIFVVLLRMASPYDVRPEDWLFLRIWSILESLDTYRKAGLEPDRNRAVKRLRRVISDVEDWEVSHLALVKETVGKHVIPLKRNLRDRLRPAVEEGDEENLGKSYNFLRGFAEYLVKEKPIVDDIDNLNSLLATITTTPSEKLGFKSKLSTSFRIHRRLQHFFVFIVCGFAGFLAFLIGHWYLSVPIEISYPAGLTVAVGLIAGYLNYMRK